MGVKEGGKMLTFPKTDNVDTTAQEGHNPAMNTYEIYPQEEKQKLQGMGHNCDFCILTPREVGQKLCKSGPRELNSPCIHHYNK